MTFEWLLSCVKVHNAAVSCFCSQPQTVPVRFSLLLFCLSPNAAKKKEDVVSTVIWCFVFFFSLFFVVTRAVIVFEEQKIC